MKRKINKLPSLFFSLGLLALLAMPQVGMAVSNNRVVNLPASAQVAGDYYDAGSIVNSAGSVSGDLMTAGGSVDISGQVSGDMLAAGGVVNLSGDVGGSARVVGGSLTLSGKIVKNLTAAGGSLKLGADSQVAGNTYLAGGTVLAGGASSGTLLVAARQVELSGKVAGSVTVYADSLSVLDGAEISGDLTYYSDNPVAIAQGATVKGKVTQKPAVTGAFKKTVGVSAPGQFAAALWKILSFLVIALVAWRIWTARLQQLLSGINSKFWEKLLWGLLGLIAVPAGSVIIALTAVGLPLAFIILGLYLISMLLAGVFAFLAFGKWLGGLLNLGDRPGSFPWYAFFLGAIVLSVIAFVPFIGPLVVFVVWLWSLGTLYSSLG